MEISSYVDGILGTLSELTAIHSPTGYTKDAADYVFHALKKLGYAPEQTRKGGVLCCLGGPEGSEGLLLSAPAGFRRVCQSQYRGGKRDDYHPGGQAL